MRRLAAHRGSRTNDLREEHDRSTPRQQGGGAWWSTVAKFDGEERVPRMCLYAPSENVQPSSGDQQRRGWPSTATFHRHERGIYVGAPPQGELSGCPPLPQACSGPRAKDPH